MRFAVFCIPNILEKEANLELLEDLTQTVNISQYVCCFLMKSTVEREFTLNINPD